jgi:hypothetical protein
MQISIFKNISLLFALTFRRLKTENTIHTNPNPLTLNLFPDVKSFCNNLFKSKTKAISKTLNLFMLYFFVWLNNYELKNIKPG